MNSTPRGTRLASYERTSRDDGEPERQGNTIQVWATTNHLAIAKRYIDQGGRRHEAASLVKRPAWNQLLADVRAGHYDLLAVEELSRVGFADEYELMSLCHLLRQHGVELWEAKSGRLCNGDDVAGFLTTGIGGNHSRAEMMNLGTRSLGGKAAKAARGCYLGSPIPLGMAVECRTPSGHVKWRVEIGPDQRRHQYYADGREIWHSPRYFPKDRDKGEDLYLVPTTDYPERLETVRNVYQWFLTERVSLRELGQRLNRMNLPTPSGRLWSGAHVYRLLTTSIYTGQTVWGRRRQGRYAIIEDGRAIPAPGDGKVHHRPAEQWIWSEPLFPAIVSREDWVRVQAKIPNKTGPRVGKNPDLLLSGLLYCADCGQALTGLSRENRKPYLSYRCSTHVKSFSCGNNQVSQEIILEILDRWLEEVGQTLQAAGEAGEGGLLAALYTERAGVREALAGLREAIEGHLFEALTVLSYEDLPDGSRRFTIPQHGAPDLVLTIPGVENFETLREFYGWVSQAENRTRREKLASVEARHDRLMGLWAEAPTHLMRQKLAAQIRETEAALSELRAAGAGLGDLVRDLLKQMHATTKALLKARRELAGSDARRKSQALRELVERVECRWELMRRSPKSEQMVRRLVEVRVVPLVPGEDAVCTLQRTSWERGFPRWHTHALARTYRLYPANHLTAP